MKTSNDFEKLRIRLRSMSEAEHKELADRSGVPFSTVRKVAYSVTENPRWKTVSRLMESV